MSLKVFSASAEAVIEISFPSRYAPFKAMLAFATVVPVNKLVVGSAVAVSVISPPVYPLLANERSSEPLPRVILGASIVIEPELPVEDAVR